MGTLLCEEVIRKPLLAGEEGGEREEGGDPDELLSSPSLEVYVVAVKQQRTVLLIQQWRSQRSTRFTRLKLKRILQGLRPTG